MKRNLWETTAGERLWLLRRRLGAKRKTFAPLCGVCQTTLWRLETDQRQITRAHLHYVETLPVRAIGRGDLCALARRRSGMELRAVAKAMGTSHVTYLTAEEMGIPEVVNFWRSKGFRFPLERER